MQHLDEGTIHAWLDGALPADEAARVEAHAAECARCAPLVAEARGLVAGASRILSALDDVGAVMPAAGGGWGVARGELAGERRHAEAVPTDAGATIRPEGTRPRAATRRWFRPATLAAAASVVLMVGTAVVWTESGGPVDRGVMGVAGASDTAAAALQTASAPEVAPANARPGGTRPPAVAPSDGSRPLIGSTAGMASRAGSGAGSTTAAVTPANRPSAPRGPAATPLTGSRRRALTDRAASVEEGRAADATAPPARREVLERTVPAAPLPAPAPAAAAANEPTAQRRLSPNPPPAMSAVVVTGVDTDTLAGVRRRAAATSARTAGSIAGRGAPAAQKSLAAADSVGRVDSLAIARRDTLAETPEYRALRRQRAASALEPNRPMAPRGVFALAACYAVVEGRGLPRLVTLDTTRFIRTTGRDEPRYVARADRAIGYWTPEGLGGVRIGIAGAEIVARIEPPDGELRGTVRRGAKKERFVARRGCS